MTIYEEKTIKITERIAVKKVCDICGKESKKLEYITHNHNSWGNDSIDSYENIEICSNPKCYKGAFEKFKNSDNARYPTAVFDDMEYSKLKILLEE